MALILNIDTALETASVCIAEKGEPIALEKNQNQKDHASWLHSAIQGILVQSDTDIKDLLAIAVSNGPGSYTGLRVSLATAKGMCYALNIPLIAVNTLEIMAYAAIHSGFGDPAAVYIPMIDARRMEVFTAAYDHHLQLLMPQIACITNEETLSKFPEKNPIIIFGNGSRKYHEIFSGKHVIFAEIDADATHLGAISAKYYLQNKFADLAYTEPFYIKDFYTPAKGL